MTTITAPATERASSEAQRKYLRGSQLLLFGRFVSIFINLAVQVLTVRYLAKADYGAFAYALAMVSMGSSAIQMGMGRSIPRLAAIHYARKDYPRTFGSIALATYTIWGLGVALVLLVFGLRGVLSGRVIADPQALSVLLVLIVLTPVQAYTSFLEHLVTVFVGARAIFFRRQVAGPGLKLAAVLTVILTRGDVYLLAYGYLLGGLVSVWICAAILLRAWRRQQLLRYLRPGRMLMPVRELFGFSLPLFSSELSLIMRTALVVILLESFHSTGAVAEYRAVLPIAGLNMLVYEAMKMLYVPVASRMYAAGDRAGISQLYWKTCLWITVLTAPVLAITFAMAEPVTLLLFGTTYAGAGVVLAILAAGHYFHAALGFNAASLLVHGKLRQIVVADVIAAAGTVCLGLLLIPRYGAVGAAVTTTGALVLHNVANQLGLRLGDTGIRVLEWQFIRAYLVAAVTVAALFLVQWSVSPPIHLSAALVAIASLVMIRSSRRALDPASTFPEILKIPGLRQLLT